MKNDRSRRDETGHFSKNMTMKNIKDTMIISNKDLYHCTCMSAISEEIKMRRWRWK